MKLAFAIIAVALVSGCSNLNIFEPDMVDFNSAANDVKTETSEMVKMADETPEEIIEEVTDESTEEGAASDMIDVAPTGGRKVFLLEGGTVDYDTFRA